LKIDTDNGNDESDINVDEKKEYGEDMTSKKTSLSKDAQGVAIVALGFIFAVYGFFAFTNSDKYPILQRISTDPIVHKISLVLAVVLMAVGIYMIYKRVK